MKKQTLSAQDFVIAVAAGVTAFGLYLLSRTDYFKKAGMTFGENKFSVALTE